MNPLLHDTHIKTLTPSVPKAPRSSILFSPRHLPPLPSSWSPVSAAVGGPGRRRVPPDRWIGPGAIHAEPSGARGSAQRRGRRLLGRPKLAGEELDDGHPGLVRLQRRQLRVTTCGETSNTSTSWAHARLGGYTVHRPLMRRDKAHARPRLFLLVSNTNDQLQPCLRPT